MAHGAARCVPRLGVVYTLQARAMPADEAASECSRGGIGGRRLQDEVRVGRASRGLSEGCIGALTQHGPPRQCAYAWSALVVRVRLSALGAAPIAGSWAWYQCRVRAESTWLWMVKGLVDLPIKRVKKGRCVLEYTSPRKVDALWNIYHQHSPPSDRRPLLPLCRYALPAENRRDASRGKFPTALGGCPW